MDEFGRPAEEAAVEEKQDKENVIRPELWSTGHDQVCLPARTSPSPAPFADYAPIRSPGQTFSVPAITYPEDVRHMPPQEEEDKDGAGCCKCVIM